MRESRDEGGERPEQCRVGKYQGRVGYLGGRRVREDQSGVGRSVYQTAIYPKLPHRNL